MEMEGSSGPVRGMAAYTGFKASIKAVAVGPRGSRALGFDEARAAFGELLDGSVSPAQAGAFLIGLRVKGETPAELAGAAQALRDRCAPLEAGPGAPLVLSAGAFDGLAEAPPLGIAAAACAAACGVRVVVACGDRLGPKNGVTAADVVAALGGPERPGAEASAAMLERSGVGLAHAGELVEGWRAIAAIRDEIGLRGPLHSAEKLVDFFGARCFVVGHTHGSYGERIIGALEQLGCESAIAVRGIEGSDLLRPGRPVARGAAGPIGLPESPGMQLRGDSDPAYAAALSGAVLAGEENGAARRAVTLSAGVKLLAAGVAGRPADALRRCEAAIDEGSARAVLDAIAG